jgi:hypothetical protein
MVFLTLTEVIPCFFLSCKANVRVKLAKTGHGPHSSKLVFICVVRLLFVLFNVLFVCKCVLYYCHRVTTQLQLTNIYHIIAGKGPSTSWEFKYLNPPAIENAGSWHCVWPTCYKNILSCPLDLMSVQSNHNRSSRHGTNDVRVFFFILFNPTH